MSWNDDMAAERARPAPRDLDAAADIAGRGLAATTAAIGDLHAAIAARVFTLTGPPAVPVRLVHNGISRSAYAAVGGGARAFSTVAGRLAETASSRRAGGEDRVSLSDTPRGEVVVGALNGAWGDSLARWRNPLALRMAVRVAGRDVELTGNGLNAAFADASGDVVVFVHGLCETDRAWWLHAADHYGDAHSSHGARLAQLADVTPVYLRYNTGLHISDNGEQLAGLLDALVARWPVPLHRLTLVGHSMGGLVIRSACCHADGGDQTWLPLVRRIVYLGSPHLGAPLELAATAAGVALRKLPETRPLASALASRSVGIKDLRYGDIRPTDWADLADPDAWRAEPTDCAALHADAQHYYIGATLTRDRDHPVARIVGDALVTFPSASGKSTRRDLAFEIDRGCHLGGLHHFDLLNHPRVWALLRQWLVTEDA
jgi:hypothetical protein